MRLTIRPFVLFLLGALVGAPAEAQDRPFVFSVSTPPSSERSATVYVDAGVGEHALDVTDSERFEQRIGVQSTLGTRWTLLARVALSQDERDTSTSQQGELIYNVINAPAHEGSVGVGLGLRHELAGTNVLLGRIVAGRALRGWRIDGNALFEKPFAGDRDGADLISSVGLARRLTSAFYAGVEMIGEDLEGFWEKDEAEGGARLMIGPSIRLAPPTGHWQISAAGGPIVRASQSSRVSDASRSLPPSNGSQRFGAKASFSYRF